MAQSPTIRLRSIEGDAPVIFVAPHGGRRAPAVRRGDGVNDLHTDVIAAELARRCCATALINDSIDRNDADLNRISVLAGESREVLQQLLRAIGRIEQTGRRPLVLFVHGWNMAVTACDLGVGVVEIGGRLHGRYPTIARATLHHFIDPLREQLGRSGIDAPLGRRYPASGRDNATQLFSGRHRDAAADDVRAIARLAAEGRADAVQLELAIPLRWPGGWRDAFMAACEYAVDAYRRRGASAPAAPRRREWGLPAIPKAGSIAAPAVSLQAALEGGDGLFVGAEAVSDRRSAGRFCVARADGALWLFVGEDGLRPGEREIRVGGFCMKLDACPERPGLSRVLLEAPVLIYPDHEAFCDLETGLAAAQIVEGRADIRVHLRSESHVVLEGYVRAGKERLEVEGAALLEHGSARRGAGGSRVIVCTPAGISQFLDRDGIEWREHDGRLRGFAVRHPRLGMFTGETRVCVPVFRPLGDGRYVKISFGTAAIRDRAGAGSSEGRYALFERIEMVGDVLPGGNRRGARQSARA